MIQEYTENTLSTCPLWLSFCLEIYGANGCKSSASTEILFARLTKGIWLQALEKFNSKEYLIGASACTYTSIAWKLLCKAINPIPWFQATYNIGHFSDYPRESFQRLTYFFHNFEQIDGERKSDHVVRISIKIFSN